MTSQGKEPAGPPAIFVRDGKGSRRVVLNRMPFVIGRGSDSDLVFTQPFISRKHAEIFAASEGFLLRDNGGLHGTYVNGKLIRSRALRTGDSIRFGAVNGPEIRFGVDFDPPTTHTSSSDLLGKIQELQSEKSDLQKLQWFLEAARDLSSAGAVDRIMASLLGATIRLAKVERGFVFLMDAAGSLELVAGMDASGNELEDSSTISRTAMQQAIEGKEQFLITDTLTAEGVALPESMVMQQLRAAICIPLRQHRQRGGNGEGPRLLGLLYLDSRFEPAQFTNIDHDLLRTISREAAALAENAQLAVVEESARKQAEELQFAARIQQAIMATQIPRADFARVEAHSVACSAVGGDFYDVILSDEALNVALVDVSGKGTSAAILASILQGMLYVQLEAGRPLREIAASVNEYLCRKAVGKYATMVLASLRRDGHLEYINCGHVRPRIAAEGRVFSLDEANMPVGLLPSAKFESAAEQLRPGARLLLVSDGFTEAPDPEGNFFGDEGLEQAAHCSEMAAILDLLQEFCKGAPATDDCTLVQLEYVPAQVSLPGDGQSAA